MLLNVVQRKWVAGLFCILVGVAFAGCATTADVQQQGQPVTGPTQQGTAGWEEVGRFYLDDVRVPSELDFDADESMVYEAAKFKAGVLRFSKWRIDVQSVSDFFMYNLPRDQWTFVNAFKGKETQLTFTKPDKTCVIRISQSWTGMTKVLIAVGPLGEKKM